MNQKAHKKTSYGEIVKDVMEKNEKFLKENAKETLEEVSYFASVDIIEYVKFAASPDLKESYANWAMVSFIFHILQPLGYGIWIDLLVGNLPVCFFGLRVLLESLVRHYYADAKYPSHLFFQQKLELLEIDFRERKISEMMKDMDKLLMLGNKCYSLWKEIFSKWIHSKGIIDRITEQIIEKKDVPPWGLIIPCPYNKNDLSDIKEFQKKFSSFRRINREAVESWKKYFLPQLK